MPQPLTPTPESILRTYFRAKDENRPHLLDRVFSPDATLDVRNASASIAFPAETVGRDAIADVLVRRFGQIHENVYSFCMGRPPDAAAAFRCDWLVCMSEKDSKCVRVGCGRYDWQFQAAPPHLASRLTITIEAMLVLPPPLWESISSWLGELNYPWSSAGAVAAAAPGIGMLAPVLRYLGREENDA